jgi:hypothetical protein
MIVLRKHRWGSGMIGKVLWAMISMWRQIRSTRSLAAQWAHGHSGRRAVHV